MKTKLKMSKWLMLVCLLAMSFVLASCGGGKAEDKASIQGKWELKASNLTAQLDQMAADGETLKFYMVIDADKMDLMINDKPALDFLKDKLSSMGVDPLMLASYTKQYPFPMTYKELGDNKIEVTSEKLGTHQGEYKLDGDNLTLTVSGDDLEMVRAK